MPTYKVTKGKRVEFLHAKNEAQLDVAIRQVFGDTQVRITTPTAKEMNSLVRSHSYPVDEE